MNFEDFLWKRGNSTRPPVCVKPFSYHRPVTPTANAAVVSPASPPPLQQDAEKEPPPRAQTDDTTIQIEQDIYTLKTQVSENPPIKVKGFGIWDECVIL